MWLKWNEEAAPNNNIPSEVLQSSKFVSHQQQNEHEFSEELSDGGERDEIIKYQQKKKHNT